MYVCAELHMGQREPVPTGRDAITGGSQMHLPRRHREIAAPHSHKIPQTCKIPLHGEQKRSVRILMHMAIKKKKARYENFKRSSSSSNYKLLNRNRHLDSLPRAHFSNVPSRSMELEAAFSRPPPMARVSAQANLSTAGKRKSP